MRSLFGIFALIVCAGCGSAPTPSPSASKAPAQASQTGPVKITQFYAADHKIPRGVKGNICYGVENAEKLELTPAADVVWPSPARCIEVSPKQTTTYTLTAYGADGAKTTKTAEMIVGSAPPRLYDLSVNSTQVHPGQQIVVCFKVENAKSIKAGPGHFDSQKNCLADNPAKTTVYKIAALGDDNQMDSGTVTVKVK